MTGTESDLAGRHALVTGAGGGIGAAIARALGRRGARVTLAGRRREPLVEVASTLPEASALALDGFDVTDEAAIARGLGAGARRVRAGRHPRQQRRRGAERAVRENWTGDSGRR